MLKIYGQLKNVILEAYGNDDDSKFIKKYGGLTGKNCRGHKSFLDRANRNWKNQFRVYFDAELWVVDSLRKIGCNVMENKTPKSITEAYGNGNEMSYIVSNIELFWQLVDYGYRLGENSAIPFEMYKLRQALGAMQDRVDQIVPELDISLIEAEDPIFEAQMFAEAM